MSKLAHLQASRPTAAQAVVRSKHNVPDAVTYEGAPGFRNKPKAELFLLAVSNMVGEDTFYEGSTERDTRFRALIAKVAAKDPDWVSRFVPYLRNVMNMRTAAVVMAAEYALTKPSGGVPVRQVVASALQRPDEPAEFIAYWVTRTGKRTLPGGVQRGVADAVTRLFTEYAALKYDGTSQPWRMGDVVELCHPTPKAPWQGDLFSYLLDRRHHPDDVRADFSKLETLRTRAAMLDIPQEQRRDITAEALKWGGFTWETYATYLNGPMDAQAWERIIPNMGYMALLRNLRNFEQAGISRSAMSDVCAFLADPEQVVKSRQLPMRFLSAFKAAQSVHWHSALEDALNLSLQNVPTLAGDSLILVDMSGSMFAPLSARSELQRAEAAAVFGAALYLRNPGSRLVCFGSTACDVNAPQGSSLLPLVKQMTVGMGGTETGAAARAALLPTHKRVVVLTDEQEGMSYGRGPTINEVVPEHVWLHTFNLAGYKVGSTPAGHGRRSAHGGLTDAGFKALPLLEAGTDEVWPF